MIKGADFFLVFLALAVFSWGVLRRVRLWSIGKKEAPKERIGKRIALFLKEGVAHTRILKETYPGLLHLFLFTGFIIPFGVVVITQFVFTLPLLAARIISLLLDLIGIAAVASLLLFLLRRTVRRPPRLDNRTDDFITLGLILLILLTGFMVEGLRLSVIGKDTHAWAPAGNLISSFLNSFTGEEKTKALLAMVFFRLHFLSVLAAIAYIPYSKLFHLIASPLNMVSRSLEPFPSLSSLNLEDEEAESFGISRIEEFTRKQLMDLDACTRCGRCQDRCPAFLSEKPLSPKLLIAVLKEHLYRHGPQILKARTRGEQSGEGVSLVERVIEEDVLWSCTTCRSCSEHCPVCVEHVDKIIDMRRYQVLMESKFPPQLNSFFRSMETNSNPWGIGFASRGEWAEDLEVKLVADFPQAEYLFWVGCAGSFDEEGKKIAEALVSIMKKAGLSFAILGPEEKCCGDQARRLGNEYLFQMQAAENVETFIKYGVKKIVTICPHGYNLFKNEYPRVIEVLPGLSSEAREMVMNLEVIHHVQLIHTLLEEGRLHLKGEIEGTLTYHDSCYLGRYNKIFKEPREILGQVCRGRMVELENSGQHSFCCGAGGGLMWTEETRGKRINHMRTDEVIASGAETAVTSCPFCLTMLQDGIKDKEQTGVKVRDIAQIVAELL